MGRARHRADTRRARTFAVAVAAAVLIGSGVSGWAAAAQNLPAANGPSGRQSSSAALTGASAGLLDPVAEAPKEAAGGQTVASVSIPSIGVSAPTEQLTRDASGALQPPTVYTDTGWYRDGVLPGQVGPAVIAGHIDSTDAPAVFAHLADLRPGALVHIRLSGGSVVDFTVDRSIQVSKGDFPTGDVYGPTPTPQLRIITCGGTFDPSIGHYDDNIVVFASLAA
jgi:sortase (surface protein transpeptidase)